MMNLSIIVLIIKPFGRLQYLPKLRCLVGYWFLAGSIHMKCYNKEDLYGPFHLFGVHCVIIIERIRIIFCSLIMLCVFGGGYWQNLIWSGLFQTIVGICCSVTLELCCLGFLLSCIGGREKRGF